MKTKMMLLLAAMLLVLAVSALADEGVKLIGGPAEVGTESVSLDDLKLKADVEIPGYGIITAVEFSFVDQFRRYDGDGRDGWSQSGENADYAMLTFNMLNKRTTAMDFMFDITGIVVTYDDVYQYEGWCYQRDYARSYPTKKFYEISPMYECGFIIGCTLPNAVVKDTKPLTLTFKLGENEITYNIRK